MKRNYDEASGVTGTTLFVGKEIERTPAYGMKTLFVVGTDTPVAEILVLAKESYTCIQQRLCKSLFTQCLIC